MADSDVQQALEDVVRKIGGVWVLVKNENLDEYLKEIGKWFIKKKEI